ncbi:MAG: biopolymer transporter ExbD [Myxococcales bacterium]|nr:biopolymer transporter ExbD [Myxococcales bacterium]
MNVTPLVDVVLVLLIVFMVVLPAMEEGANVEVPGVVHADAPHESEIDPFVLTVSRGGALMLDDRPVAREGLEAALVAARDREPHRRLVLRGDRSTRYAEVREIAAVAARLGFPGMALRVNQRSFDVDDAEP